MGSIPGSGRSPGGGNGNPLQYSCLENPMERGDWWAKVRGVAESDMTEQLTHYGPNVLDSYQCCSLQHWTLLLPPVTSTAGWCFCFGSISSFFLELFLQWSPGAYWAPTDLWSYLSMSYLFAFSYCSWGSQGRNTEVVCHSLLQWITF